MRVEIDPIQAEMTVDELLACYPATTRVFVRHRMACVGCEIVPFETSDSGN
jgi:hybrid cluster-associated redox disulfide protein